MDNVLNRPLFRHREARDRLNESVGVQRFRPGGEVIPGAGNPDFGGGSRAPVNMTADPSGAIIRQYRQRSVRPEGLPSLVSADQNVSQYFEAGRLNDAVAAAEEKLRRAQFYFDNDPGGENVDLYRAASEELEALKKQQEAFLETAVPTVTYEPELPGVLAVEGPERLMSQLPFADQQKALDIFRNLDRAAVSAGPEVEASGATAPKAAIPGAASTDPSTDMGFEARRGRAAPVVPSAPADSGPTITDPAAVAAGLNAEDPAVREKTVTDFMQEYAAAAPKYEGMDKNLMLAQIGFAIAAGESPNAMQNIANGLLAGSDVLIKDKAAKAEFDRQVQLNAMQYGFETTKAERERGRQPLSFVALEDTVYKGKPVKKGQPVMIPYSEIERNGGMVPAGFGDSTMVTALAEKQAAILDILEEARKEKILDDSTVDTRRKDFSLAASKALSAQRGIEYMEAALITIGEGGVVGLKGSANQVIKDGLALFGLSQADQFDSREEALSLVSKGFQNVIPVAFSGTQTGNSISNFDVEQLAKAYVDAMFKDGVFSLANVTEEKLMNSLKGALELLESGRQSALTDMTAIEQSLVGRTLASGLSGTSILDPYREMIPQEEDIKVPSVLGSLYRSDDGIYRLRVPGG